MSKIIAPLIMVAIGIGLLTFYVMPMYNSVLIPSRALEKRLDDAISRTTLLDSRRQELNTIFNGFKREDAQRIMRLMPDRFEVVQAIIDLDTLAANHHVTINRFAPPKSERAAASVVVEEKNDQPNISHSLESVVLKISCTGTYEAFKDFLHNLEASLTLFDVTDLSISAGSKNAGTDELTYELAVKSYWLK